MNRYWDMDTRARLALTDAEIETCIARERMVAGVIEPTPVDGMAALGLPPPQPSTTVYQVSGSQGQFDAIFRTREQAEAFIALSPMIRRSEWQLEGQWVQDSDEFSVAEVRMFNETELRLAQPALKAIKESASSRKDMANKYRDEMAEWMEPADKIRCDIETRHRLVRLHESVVNRFSEYVEMADGDRSSAIRFLCKTYSRATVRAAFEWHEITDYVPEEPVEELIEAE